MRRRNNQASRKADLRGAFFIVAISLGLSLVFYFVRRSISLSGAELFILSALETILILLLPACAGLFYGLNQSAQDIRLNKIDSNKMVYLFLMGLFVLFPTFLLESVIRSLLMHLGFMAVGGKTGGASIFFPSILLVGLLKPIAAALFYDEFIIGIFRKSKQKMGPLVAILIATIQIGLYQGFAGACCIAILLILCYGQSSSLLAPILFYSGYGFGLTLAEFFGSQAFSLSMGPLTCCFLIVGTLAEYALVLKVWRVPAKQEALRLPEKISFTKKEQRFLLVTGIAVMAAVIISEVSM